jgi:hypothetical protein
MLAASENVLYVQGFPSTVLAVAAVAIRSADVEGAKEASSGADGRCHS